MASIKLKHASGNSTILNSPAANPTNDVTLKLPSTTGSAGQVLKVASANHSSTNAELEFAAATGKIVKYVTTGPLTANKVTSGSTELEMTNVSITPASSSNKILVLSSASVFIYGTSNAYGGFRIYRGAIGGTTVFRQFVGLSANSYPYGPAAFSFIDTPNTSSSQQYTLAMQRGSGNTDRLETDGQYYSLTLIELEP